MWLCLWKVRIPRRRRRAKISCSCSCSGGADFTPGQRRVVAPLERQLWCRSRDAHGGAKFLECRVVVVLRQAVGDVLGGGDVVVRDVAGAHALAHVVRRDVDVLGAVVVGAVGLGLDGAGVVAEEESARRDSGGRRRLDAAPGLPLHTKCGDAVPWGQSSRRPGSGRWPPLLFPFARLAWAGGRGEKKLGSGKHARRTKTRLPSSKEYPPSE